MGNTVAIIDPISSGRLYGREAKAIGFKPIAVLTGTPLSDALKRFASVESFDEVHHMKDVEKTARFLRSRDVKAVLAGHHFALRVVDNLAGLLGLVGNSLDGVEARLNKLAMKRRLHEHGVPATQSRGICTKNLSDFKRFGMSFPVVLKPSEGSGSLSVKICRSLDEIRSGLIEIESLDLVYSGNERISLVEEYIEGPEYFITTANYGDGNKQLLCFARYEKVQTQHRPSIYKNIYSLPIDSDAAQAAFRYACDINRALGVEHGINDIEFKLTPHGPLVIEQNNRLPGANVPALIERCTGINCYWLNLGIFSDTVPIQKPEVIYRKHFFICCLANDVVGTVIDVEGMDVVKALPGVVGVDLMVEVGEVIDKTTDFITTWAFVYMIHEDPQLLRRNADFVHANLRLSVAPPSRRDLSS